MEVRNRFKRLDLIDRVPDELWTEVCDTVKETGIKTIPPKKEMIQMDLFTKEKQTHRLREGIYCYVGGGR